MSVYSETLAQIKSVRLELANTSKRRFNEVSNTKGCAYHRRMSKRTPDKVSPKNCDRTQNDSANTSIERSNRHIPAQNGQNSIITSIFHTYTSPIYIKTHIQIYKKILYHI